MKKLGRNSLALGAATLLVTGAVQFSATAADGDIAQATSSALNTTGLLGILNSQTCEAATANDQDATPTGTCGNGLDYDGVVVTAQNATATVDDDNNGQSTAEAGVAPLDVTGLEAIQLSDLDSALASIDTGTILDDVVGALDPVVQLVLGPVLDALGDALVDPLLDGVGGSLPVSIEIGAVTASCQASPTSATATTEVAGIDVVIDLGGQRLVIPMNVGTSPNSPLVGYNEDAMDSAVAEIVNSVVDGLEETLNTSLGGVLGPLGAVVAGVQDMLLAPVLDALGPALLEPVGNLLDEQLGLVGGTVNVMEDENGAPVNGSTDDVIHATALELHVGLAGTSLATAELADVTCGKNLQFVPPATDADADADADAAADADAIADADAAADADADADAIADADSAADADASAALPDTGAPNLMPFFLLGLALMAFGAAVLVNERRRLGDGV